MSNLIMGLGAAMEWSEEESKGIQTNIENHEGKKYQVIEGLLCREEDSFGGLECEWVQSGLSMEMIHAQWQPWEEPREYDLSYNEARAKCESCPSAEANSEHCDKDAWFHVDGSQWFDDEGSLVDFGSLDDAARCILGKWCIRILKAPILEHDKDIIDESIDDEPVFDLTYEEALEISKRTGSYVQSEGMEDSQKWVFKRDEDWIDLEDEGWLDEEGDLPDDNIRAFDIINYAMSKWRIVK